MIIYTNDIVNNARELRKEGLSCRAIGQKLQVSDGTIGRWCKDILINTKQLIKAEETRNKIKTSEVEFLQTLLLDQDLAKLSVSLLYWCEGTKYPQSKAVSFSNSDPNMIVLFVKLLRESFPLEEKKFKIHLQLHSTHDKKKMFEYWSDLLDIPENQFWVPTITEAKNKMKRQDYFGTCTVRYHDYTILLKMIGIYEIYMERWLSGRKQRTANALSS